VGFPLLENRRAKCDVIDRQDQLLDLEPVVKLFTADGNAIWLLWWSGRRCETIKTKDKRKSHGPDARDD
jgi:hypothetical protein